MFRIGWLASAREMQTKFMSMIIDETHERYLQKAKPEDVKRLLESYVETLKEDIVDCLRQRE